MGHYRNWIAFFIVFLACFFNVFSCYEVLGQSNFIKGELIVKVKEESRDIFDNYDQIPEWLDNAYKNFGIYSVEKKFPRAEKPKQEKINGIKAADLTRIYTVLFNDQVYLPKVRQYFSRQDEIEYAEPHYLPELLYVPDDPKNSLKYELTNIMAYEGWDISKGDTSVVIGISDTGTDIDHEDLIDNIAYNYNDPFPFNGIDDDNDGFIDNFRGWDLGENDKNPQWNTNQHGVYVSGLASAMPDNGLGLTGTGFYCRFLPIKISNSDGLLTMAYESIVYAADHGCTMVNCSWGNTSYSAFEQDVVDYATVNRNCLVIAAAGNNNNDMLFYPASYDHVLSVAGTDINDFKWTQETVGSSFGYGVDICAPSYQNTSTVDGGYLTGGGGTSFASPITAGCAGIVASFFPDYSALQIAEQIRATTDLIDTIPENVQYSNLMGTGRLNLYNALTTTNAKSVKFKNVQFEAPADFIRSGDTVRITGDLVNFLDTINNLQVSISNVNSLCSVIGNQFSVGQMLPMSISHVGAGIFIVVVDNSSSFNKQVVLRIDYQADGYSDYEFIWFNINQTVLDLDTNNITTSGTSVGRIGYVDFDQTMGKGFRYKGMDSFLFEGGLILGNSLQNIADCFRMDQQFYALSFPEKRTDTIGDVFIQSKFREYVFNFKIDQNLYAWNSDPYKDLVLVEYELINNTANQVNDLMAGVLADWDVLMPSENRISFNEAQRMSMIYRDTTARMAGVKLLSPLPYNHYAIDGISGGGGGIDITDSDGFSLAEKYISMTTTRNEAGMMGNGSDVIDVISYGPLNMAPGDTVKLLFAFLAAENMTELEENGTTVQLWYDSLVGLDPISKDDNRWFMYPNPANDKIYFDFEGELAEKFTRIEVFSADGVKVLESKYDKSIYSLNISNLSPGIYFVRADSGKDTLIRKLIILR